jgi:hypothetical protein
MWFFHLKIWNFLSFLSFFSFQNKKAPIQFTLGFLFFLVRFSQCENLPKNNNLHCHLANGCGFTQSKKLFGTFWHQLKINQIVKLTKLFGTFWNLLSSVHSIYLERVKPFHISHSKVNLESLVKGYILHNPFGRRPCYTQHDVEVNLISKLSWHYRTLWLGEKL